MSDAPGPVTMRPMTAEERKRYPLQVNRDLIVQAARRNPRLTLRRLAGMTRVPVEIIEGILAGAGIERVREKPGDRLSAAMLRADIEAGLTVGDMSRKYNRSMDRMGGLVGLLKGDVPPGPDIPREIAEGEGYEVSESEIVEKERAVRESDAVRAMRAEGVLADPPGAEPRAGKRTRLRRDQWPSVEQIKAARLRGLSWDRVTAELGVGSASLVKILRSAGLRMRDCPGPETSAGTDTGTPAATVPEQAPDREEGAPHPLVYCRRRGMSGQVARNRLAGIAIMLAETGLYDLHIEIKEVG